MRKLIILVMLGIGSLGYAHRSRQRPSRPPQEDSNCNTYGTTTMCVPKCKDENARNKEFGEFKNQLISNGYIIVKAITSDTSFDILVRDSVGNEHWEHKDWCKF